MNRPASLLLVLGCILAGVGLYVWAFKPFDVLVMLAWAALALATWWPMRRAPLAAQRAWWVTLLAFPLWEFGLKWMITRNVIPYSWWWLNRLEHWGWMAASLVLLLPAYRAALHLPYLYALLFVVGLGGLIGNANEFFEYALRLRAGGVDRAVLYRDTVQDLLVNVAGALTAFLVVWRVASPRSDGKDVERHEDRPASRTGMRA